MRLKNTIRVITLIPLMVYLTYCSYHFIANDTRPSYLDCGKVVSKSSDEVAIKYGVKTELYLNIQFNKSGFRSVECSPTTYFSKQIGDNVCFNLDEYKGFWYNFNSLVGCCVLVILGVATFVWFIYYLIPDSWKED